MFTLTINTDNAAFGDEADTKHAEVAAILRNIAAKIEKGRDCGMAIDTNGNAVGDFVFSDRD